MKLVRYCFLSAIFSILALMPALAGGVKIIANASVAAGSASADEIKAIFLQEKKSLGSASVEPVLLKGGAAHEVFLKQYVGKTDSALQTYYRSMVFTGKGSMPKTLASDAEVAAYVAKTKGAIGYISDGAGADGVKVLEIR